jgi:glycosyltransferase involved in cell wall biosynthesis
MNRLVTYILIDIYPCKTGGFEIFYHELLREISKTENVLLITSCKEVDNSKFHVEYISKKYLSIPHTKKIATLLFTASKILKYRKKIKLIHLPYAKNSGKWGYILPLFKKLFNIPYLLHIHGGGMTKWKKRSGDKILFKNAVELLGVSDLIVREYKKRSNKQVKLIYPLVPFHSAKKSKIKLRNEYGFSEKDTILLYVGSLKELKSPETLLEAFLRLNNEFINKNNVKLIFVGGGPLKKKLKEKALASHLSDNISFTGNVPYDRVPNYYKISDVYIITSQFEGTPKTLLEAMYNGMPIIGSDVNGINNILEDEKHALLFQYNNPNLLKKCIERVQSDTNLAKKLSVNSQKLYDKKYKFQNTLKKLQDIYKKY